MLAGASAGVELPHFRLKGSVWVPENQHAEGWDDIREALRFEGTLQEWVTKLEMGPGPLPIKSLFRSVGEITYPLFFPQVGANHVETETRVREQLGPVAWKMKEELERSYKNPGDWIPELARIWPQYSPDGLREAAERSIIIEDNCLQLDLRGVRSNLTHKQRMKELTLFELRQLNRILQEEQSAQAAKGNFEKAISDSRRARERAE